MKLIRRLFFLCVLSLWTALAVTAADFDGYLLEVEFPPRLMAAEVETEFPELETVYAPAGLYRTDDLSAVDALRAAGARVYVEPNYIVTLDDTLSPVDTASLLDASGDPEEQWYTSVLDLKWPREQGLTGKSVRVGVVDSGIFKDHEEFQGVNLLDGENYCAGKAPENVADTFGHGTFVSGLIAAACNGVGIAGLAPDVELTPLKCFEGKSGSIDDISAGIYDAVNTWHCQVLNLSLGLTSDTRALRNAVKYAADKGVVMVAAAGNLTNSSAKHRDGGDPLNYPAAYPQVIGVGAVDPSLSGSWFSYRNESVELCAPGETMYGPALRKATAYTGGYGTSYAAPLVTAAAAVALSARPDLTPDGVRALLTSTARDLGETGYDTTYGYGLLQLGQLAAAASGNLSHQITLLRDRALDEYGAPLVLVTAYDENGAFVDVWDVTSTETSGAHENELPILLSGLSDQTFRVPGAVSWKLLVLDADTLAPLQSASTLYDSNTPPSGANELPIL